MRAGRTRRHHCVIGSFETMLDRDIARDEIDQPAWNEEWRQPARTFLVHQDGAILNAPQPANARPDQDARAAAFLLGFGYPSRIQHRLLGRSQAENDKIV